MIAAIALSIALALSSLVAVRGHGRLTKPVPRHGGNNPGNIENAPASGNGRDTSFICRHAEQNLAVPLTSVTAGDPLALQWTLSAAHVGDCAVYITYDIDRSLTQQRYFKIANIPDCKSLRDTDVTITIPDFLPTGQAIMRWDWYALHVRPQIEFYAQCVDIQVTGTSNSVLESQLSNLAYPITDPPIYPSSGNEGVGFRNAFNPSSEQYMTGPACVDGITLNNCQLTAVGTRGNTRDGGSIGTTPAPVSTTLELGTSTVTTTAAVPVPTVTTGLRTTTTTTTPAASTPTSTTSPGSEDHASCAVYQIVAGDSLATIAKRFTDAGQEVTVLQICNFNGLSNCNLIFAGEFLVIPHKGSRCGSCQAGWLGWLTR